MDAVFSKEYLFRTLDYDRYMRVKPSAVLDVFQDAAGFHTMQFGCDRASMKKMGAHWVLVNVRFEILRNPKPMKTVRVSTWPIVGNGVKHFREFLILDEKGDILIKGDSCWTIIDTATKRISTSIIPYPQGENYCDKEVFPDKLIKTPDFTPEKALISLKPRFSDLDFNGHVNNAKYADFITDALPDDATKGIKEFHVDYRKETAINDELMILSKTSDGYTLLKGITADGATHFTAKVKFSDEV